MGVKKMNELIFATFMDRLTTGFTFIERFTTKSLSDITNIIILLTLILVILLLSGIITVMRKMRATRAEEEFVETLVTAPTPLISPSVEKPEVEEPKVEEPEVKPPLEEIKEQPVEEPEIEIPKVEELPTKEEIEEGGFLLGEEWAKELLNELKRNIDILNFEIKKISANLDSMTPSETVGIVKDVEIIAKESKRIESELAELSIEREANKAALNTLEASFKLGRLSSERYMEAKPKYEKTLHDLEESIRDRELKLHLNELEKKKESIRQEYIQKLRDLEKEIEKEKEKVLSEEEAVPEEEPRIEIPKVEEPEIKPEIEPEEEPKVEEPEVKDKSEDLEKKIEELEKLLRNRYTEKSEESEESDKEKLDELRKKFKSE